MRRLLGVAILALLGCTSVHGGVVVGGGGKGGGGGGGGGTTSKYKMATPTLSCTQPMPALSTSVTSISVIVCAGSTGASAGFSLQWITEAQYIAAGNMWPLSFPVNQTECGASFSGQPPTGDGTRYDLGPYECVIINVGDILLDRGASTNCPNPLLCGTKYYFRAFAHANSTFYRSDFSVPTPCSTLPCPPPSGKNCTYTQGYWKTHGTGLCHSGNNDNEWPVSWLLLGTVNYTNTELCALFGATGSTVTATSGSQQSKNSQFLSMIHQLIAAKLNIAQGADDHCISALIAALDAAIRAVDMLPNGSTPSPTNWVRPFDLASFLWPMSPTLALDNFNKGVGSCSTHCAS